MRGVLLVAVVVAALLQGALGAQIQSVAFWSDSACTVPVNVTSTYNLTETSSWPGINPASVYDSESAPCANVSLGSIQSGTYTCLSNVTGIGGLLVQEYSTQNCVGAPAVQYIFLGLPNQTSCVSGELETFSAAGVPNVNFLYASVVCNNLTALPSLPSSSSGISSSSAPRLVSSSSAVPSSSAGVSSSSIGISSSKGSSPSSSSGSPSSSGSSSSSSSSVTTVSFTSSFSDNSSSPVQPSNGAAGQSSAAHALFAAAAFALLVTLTL